MYVNCFCWVSFVITESFSFSAVSVIWREHEGTKGSMYNLNYSLVVFTFFFFFKFSLFEKTVSSFWFRSLFEKGFETLTAKIREHWHPIKLHRMSWHYCLGLFLSKFQDVARPNLYEGLRIDLTLGKPLVEKFAFHAQHWVVNIKSLGTTTHICKLLRHPPVPKTERIVEFPFVQTKVFWLVVLQSAMTLMHMGYIPI